MLDLPGAVFPGCGGGPRVREAVCRTGSGPDGAGSLVECLYVAAEAVGRCFYVLFFGESDSADDGAAGRSMGLRSTC